MIVVILEAAWCTSPETSGWQQNDLRKKIPSFVPCWMLSSFKENSNTWVILDISQHHPAASFNPRAHIDVYRVVLHWISTGKEIFLELKQVIHL